MGCATCWTKRNRRGICSSPYEELLQKAHLLLNEGLPQEKVTRPVVEARLNQLLAEKKLFCDIQRVYKPDLRKAEVDVARKVLQMLSDKNSLPADGG